MTTEITYRIEDASGLVETTTRQVTGVVTVNITSRVANAPEQNITYRIEGSVNLFTYPKLLMEDGLDALLLQNGNRIRLG